MLLANEEWEDGKNLTEEDSNVQLATIFYSERCTFLSKSASKGSSFSQSTALFR
jgi:hypothetical protein